MRGEETPERFRARLRGWLQDHIAPAAIPSFTTADRKRTSAALYDEGFLGVTWPVEYGGRGLSAGYQTIVNEEIAPYRRALVEPSITVGVCAATLLDFGTEEQKTRHIPEMLRGAESWAQLLSEPGAGSDLGSVAMRAVRDGDEFVLNGQKVWTSAATESDYAVALVRTDPELQRRHGLSMVIVDLAAPGIDIRPLREMTGDDYFNEVFIDDARVPVANLLGELNGGWPVLLAMLTHERIALSAGTTGGRMDEDAFPRLLALARSRGVLERPGVRRALVDVYIEQQLLHHTGVRIREAMEAGKPLGPVGSIGKIGTAKAARDAAEAAVLIGGMPVIAWPEGDDGSPVIARSLLQFPMMGIAGGTTEIQKNIVAERLLGLPR